jgi:hypothetical protein
VVIHHATQEAEIADSVEEEILTTNVPQIANENSRMHDLRTTTTVLHTTKDRLAMKVHVENIQTTDRLEVFQVNDHHMIAHVENSQTVDHRLLAEVALTEAGHRHHLAEVVHLVDVHSVVVVQKDDTLHLAEIETVQAAVEAVADEEDEVHSLTFQFS